MKRVIGGAITLTWLLGGMNELGAQRVAAPAGVTVACSAAPLTVQWTNMANVTQYVVSQRQGGSAQVLGTVTGSPYSGPLPAAGSYEYQVTSVGKGPKNRASSPWVPCTVPNTTTTPTTTTPGVIVTEPTPVTGGTITPTIVPSAPAYLNAGSSIPGQIWLNWREVTNATAYRVTRSSNAPEPEVKIAEMSSTSQLAEGGIWTHTDAPVDLRWTYSYKVYALNGGNASPASPVATARSIAVVQPTGLKYAVTLTPTPGRVNVALTWNPVPNAAKYVVTGIDFTGTPFAIVTGTSFALNGIMAGPTYRVCVGAIYPYDVQEASTAPCIDVRLQ